MGCWEYCNVLTVISGEHSVKLECERQPIIYFSIWTLWSHLFVISDRLCALPTEWPRVGLDPARQHYVRHHVLLLAFSCGLAFSRLHLLNGLVVSNPSFNRPRWVEQVLKTFLSLYLGIFQHRKPIYWVLRTFNPEKTGDGGWKRLITSLQLSEWLCVCISFQEEVNKSRFNYIGMTSMSVSQSLGQNSVEPSNFGSFLIFVLNLFRVLLEQTAVTPASSRVDTR